MDNMHPVTGRKVLNNADGSFSTEETITVEYDGRYFNIPTIFDGKRLDEETARALFLTGANKPVGVFNSLEEAVSSAKQRSNMLGQTMKSSGLLGNQGYQQNVQRMLNDPWRSVIERRVAMEEEEKARQSADPRRLVRGQRGY